MTFDDLWPGVETFLHARRVLNRDNPEYEDMRSEAMLGVLDAIRLHRPDGGSSLMTLANERARFRALKWYWYRRQAIRVPVWAIDKGHEGVPCLPLLEMDDEDYFSPFAVDHDYLIDVLISDVRQAVSKLNAKMQPAARLFYLEGWAIKHIAAYTGVPHFTAASRIRAARGRLKQMLIQWS